MFLGRKCKHLSHLPGVLHDSRRSGFCFHHSLWLGSWSPQCAISAGFFLSFLTLRLWGFVCLKSATFCDACWSADVDLTYSNGSSMQHWPLFQNVLIYQHIHVQLINRPSQHSSSGVRYEEMMRSIVSSLCPLSPFYHAACNYWHLLRCGLSMLGIKGLRYLVCLLAAHCGINIRLNL